MIRFGPAGARRREGRPAFFLVLDSFSSAGTLEQLQRPMASLRKGRRPPEAEKASAAPVTPASAPVLDGPIRLNVGSGRVRLEGWINVDIQHLPGVDLVADVTEGLRFSNAEGVFAEHFLEHLTFDAAISFLLEAQRVLGEGRWLRLSTPNLDWVWATHYYLQDHLQSDLPSGPEAEPRKRSDAALALNRAFHGWRHQFLWNRHFMTEALTACGFDLLRWCRYGESELPVFQAIERHEIYADSSELPHVIIVEARKGEPRPDLLGPFRHRVEQDYLIHLAD